LVWSRHDQQTKYDNFEIAGTVANNIDHVTVTPPTTTIPLDRTQTLMARAFNAANQEIPEVRFTWTTSLARGSRIITPTSIKPTARGMCPPC